MSMSAQEYKALGILIASLFLIWTLAYIGYSLFSSKSVQASTSQGSRFYRDEIAFVDMQESRETKKNPKKVSSPGSTNRTYFQTLYQLQATPLPTPQVNDELAKKAREEAIALFKEHDLPVHEKYVEMLTLGATFIEDLEKARDFLEKGKFSQAVNHFKMAIQKIEENDWLHLQQALDGLVICYQQLKEDDNYLKTKKQALRLEEAITALQADAFPSVKASVLGQKALDLNEARLKYKIFLRKNSSSDEEYNQRLKTFHLDFEAYTSLATQR